MKLFRRIILVGAYALLSSGAVAQGIGGAVVTELEARQELLLRASDGPPIPERGQVLNHLLLQNPSFTTTSRVDALSNPYEYPSVPFTLLTAPSGAPEQAIVGPQAVYDQLAAQGIPDDFRRLDELLSREPSLQGSGELEAILRQLTREPPINTTLGTGTDAPDLAPDLFLPFPHSDISACNYSEEDKYLAVAYRGSSGTLLVRGWKRVQKNQCDIVIHNATSDTIGQYYLHEHGSFEPADLRACVIYGKEFSNLPADNCGESGVFVPFRRVSSTEIALSIN